VTSHRYRPPAWRWWTGAAVGAVPHVLIALSLPVAGWADAVGGEIYVVPAAMLLTLLLVFFRRTRPAATGLFGATAIGLAVVVAVAVAVDA
jgi:hypothetical protein